MLWLLIALVGSLVVLLLAAAGVVRHIGRHRARLRSLEPAEVTNSVEETNLESN
jgi:hypothetical protein